MPDLEHVRRTKRDSYHRRKNDPGKRAKQKTSLRKSQIKRRYGMTMPDWYALFIKQGCLCAICRSPHHKGRNWCVDHDHKTGQVRGILCQLCNVALGAMQDDPYYIRKLAAYIEGFHASP